MKFHIYRDKKREWRWRLVARNGRNVATSGEGYKRKASALAAMFAITRDISDGDWAVVEERK